VRPFAPPRDRNREAALRLTPTGGSEVSASALASCRLPGRGHSRGSENFAGRPSSSRCAHDRLGLARRAVRAVRRDWAAQCSARRHRRGPWCPRSPFCGGSLRRGCPRTSCSPRQRSAPCPCRGPPRKGPAATAAAANAAEAAVTGVGGALGANIAHELPTTRSMAGSTTLRCRMERSKKH